MPWLKSVTSFFVSLASCINSSSSSVRWFTVSRSSPYMRPTKRRYSGAVSRPSSAMPSGTTPICRFSSSDEALNVWPRISTDPALGSSSPVSILMVVDLPAPFGPRKPKNCPGATVNVTSSTAVSSPKRRVSPCVSIAAIGISGKNSKLLRLKQKQRAGALAPFLRRRVFQRIVATVAHHRQRRQLIGQRLGPAALRRAPAPVARRHRRRVHARL